MCILVFLSVINNITSNSESGKLLMEVLKRLRCFAIKCSIHLIRNTKDKTNATRSIVLAFIEDHDGYKI